VEDGIPSPIKEDQTILSGRDFGVEGPKGRSKRRGSAFNLSRNIGGRRNVGQKEETKKAQRSLFGTTHNAESTWTIAAH